MGKVYKYKLSSHRETELNLPSGSQVLRVDVQNGETCLWALVDPDKHTELRVFEIFGTGHQMPDFARQFINTFFVSGGEYVFHAFERI